MRSLFKLALVGAAALALFAGGASAQDATVKAGFSVTNIFGMFDDKTEIKYKDANDTGDKLNTASSRYQNEFQTDVDMTGTAGPVTARAKIRFRDNYNTATSANPPGDTAAPANSERGPETNRADIYWKVNDLFTLGLMARSLGLPASSVAYGTYNSSTCSSGCTIGEVTGPVGFFSNVRGLDLRFNVSGMTIGALLLDDCVPTCGYTALDGTLGTATKDESSMVPYFMGAFGPVIVGAYISNASGMVPGKTVNGGTPTLGGPGTAVNPTNGTADTTKDKDTAVTGTLTDVNLVVDLGMAKIAFETFSVSQSCDKKALNLFNAAGTETCSAQDTTSNVIGLRLNAGPGRVEAHLSTLETKASYDTGAGSKSTLKVAVSDLMVGYAIPINANFTINPLYASNTSVTTAETTPAAATAGKLETTRNRSFIALGGRAAF